MRASEGEQARTKGGEGRQYAVLHRHSIWWLWSAQWNSEGGDNLVNKESLATTASKTLVDCGVSLMSRAYPL